MKLEKEEVRLVLSGTLLKITIMNYSSELCYIILYKIYYIARSFSSTFHLGQHSKQRIQFRPKALAQPNYQHLPPLL